MTPTIAIIGGGPSGLTLARLLECKGIEYVVYERDEFDSPIRGGSLDIHVETGQRALKEADLFDEFNKHARKDDEVFRVCDRHGKVCFEMSEGRDAPEIDRSALRQMLLGSIPKQKIQWGHALTSATLEEDGSPVLHFANGSTASGFKLVIGADGAWSKLRPLITRAKPRYSGKHYIESRISPGNPIYESTANKVGHGTLACLGPSKQILLQRQGDGSYRVYLGVSVPEDFTRSGAVNFLDAESTRRLFLSADFFADWADELKSLIVHAPDFRSWPLYDMPPESLSWKSVPGLTLIGDAAHLTTPFAGEGVNCAMADALVLATKIAAHGPDDLDRAVEEYEEDMLPRGIRLVTKSSRNGEVMFNENNPDAFLRAIEEGKLAAQ